MANVMLTLIQVYAVFLQIFKDLYMNLGCLIIRINP